MLANTVSGRGREGGREGGRERRQCIIIIFNYFSGTLLIVDNEEEFFPAEITKLAKDVAEHGLSILVFAGKQTVVY